MTTDEGHAHDPGEGRRHAHGDAQPRDPAKRLPVIATRHTWVFAAGLVVVLLIANATVQRSILEPSYWPTLLGTLAPFVLVALASTVPILAGGGGIDISVGPTATLTNCLLAAVLFANGWTSIWVTLPIVLVVGVAVGVVNGVLVVFGRLQPVIATLATFFVLSGIALKISPNPVPATGNWTSKLSGMVGPVPGALSSPSGPRSSSGWCCGGCGTCRR